MSDLLIIKKIAEKGLQLLEANNGYFENFNVDLNTFNFFESISNLYYLENFHSDVLALILDPNTPVIGNPKFLEAFVKTLQLTDKDFKFDVNKNDVCVEKEKQIKADPLGGRIDILITNKEKKQAIIIENKINDAGDQDNQLVKYMKYVDKEMNIENYKVVYLPLLLKTPPKEKTYDNNNYGKYIQELKKRTIILPAINPNNNEKIKGYLVNDFLQQCINIFENNNKKTENDITTEVYLKQYKQLLEHLGAKSYMALLEQEIIKFIYSNNNYSNGCIEIVKQLFSQNKTAKQKRINLLGNSIIDNMEAYLVASNYINKEKTAKHYSYNLKLNNEIGLEIFTWYDDDYKDFGLGFTTDIPSEDETSSEEIYFDTEQKKYLPKILNDFIEKEPEFETLLLIQKNKSLVAFNPQWCYIEFDINAIDEEQKTIAELITYIKKCLKFCKSEFDKKLK